MTPPAGILVLMADQLPAGRLPAYGHPVVRAPHLTALADASTVYESAYTPAPLCAPARAAMLCGRYASSLGVYDNAAELPATVPTLAHALRAAGWHTAVSGKMHFVGPDQLHGFERRLTTDIYPADVDWTPDWERPLEDPLPWYHTMQSVLEPGECVASMQTDYDEEVAFAACRELRRIARSPERRPFLLFVSFTHPHDPWEVPGRYWRLYDPAEIDDPAVGPIPLSEADPHSRRLRAMCRVDEAGLTPAQVRRARHGYYAAVSYLDERVGQVLATLRECGLEEETAIVFCADHGEMLGERGLWYKMSFLEDSARVPLLLRRPGAGGSRVAEPVSLLDLPGTLLRLAGVRGELGLELDGGDLDDPGPVVVSEYEAEGVQAPAAMVRRGPWKLIVCPKDPELLYDLSSDPRELEDLAGRRPDVVRELRGELDRRLDLGEIDRRVRRSQRERRLIGRAMARGGSPGWEFSPPPGAGDRYVTRRSDLYELQRRARLDRA